MLVIVVERASQRIRGYLSSWCLQVATGVYVANLPAATREAIWAQLQDWADDRLAAVLIWGRSDEEQGLRFAQLGSPRRRLQEREGLVISLWLDREDENR
ncbi:MAG: type I-E CRISPR-associated endoribonuclease Cas2e [Gemmatimonadales bacterium]|nr:type I-E CRISPR-associated endoribonuclease Cas2e [Gemmatimonadales bacterium]